MMPGTVACIVPPPDPDRPHCVRFTHYSIATLRPDRSRVRRYRWLWLARLDAWACNYAATAIGWTQTEVLR
jgi:hypothetical protein